MLVLLSERSCLVIGTGRFLHTELLWVNLYLGFGRHTSSAVVFCSVLLPSPP
jgi:hypothetical protein